MEKTTNEIFNRFLKRYKGGSPIITNKLNIDTDIRTIVYDSSNVLETQEEMFTSMENGEKLIIVGDICQETPNNIVMDSCLLNKCIIIIV